jgi:hypothetical protein
MGYAVDGIWLQGIDPAIQNGKIQVHTHDNQDEVIITLNDSVYGDLLPEPMLSTDSYGVYVVPAGSNHGSNDFPSHGNWISIKLSVPPTVVQS